MTERGFDREVDEIAKIDYLLDNLARAVEHGEVHRASYDLMARRYLERRADLVAIVTGVPRPATPAPQVPVPPVTAERGAAIPPTHADMSLAHPIAPVRRSVDWPTVLLFMGAFLVVVASAIFSVAVWGSLGTLEKFGFLGALTVAFYGAGWWALRRLKLAVGAIALTSVASGMLLFDGWILIDGYRVEGPLPWAVLLLVCSAAYFATEVLLSGGLFGVVGAAAQITWWWLLGDGIGLPAPTRFAGIALVAIAWQFAAERGRGRPAVGTLATILDWGAPGVAAGCAVGLLGDLLLSGPATLHVVAAASLVGAASGLVLWRSERIPRVVRPVFAALVQLPVFVAAWSAAVGVSHEWWIAGVFVAAAALYYLIAFKPDGVVFAVLGLAAEISAAIEICRVLDLAAPTTVVVLAAVAALWALAARLLEHSALSFGAAFQVRQVALVAEVGAFALLVVTSLALPFATWAVPLPYFTLERADALAYVGVLAAWWASALVRPRGVTTYVGSLFSFVALSAVLTWAMPAEPTMALFMTPFVGLAGVWLASAYRNRLRLGEQWIEITRWSARATAVVFGAIGLAFAYNVDLYSRTGDGVGALGALVLLALVTIGLFVADAFLSDCLPSAAVSAVAAVASASVLGLAVASMLGWNRPFSAELVAAAGMAALVAAAGGLLHRRSKWRVMAPWFTIPAAGAGTLAAILPIGPEPWAQAGAWILIAAAWAFAAGVTSQWVVGAAGVSLVVSVWGILGDDPSEWVILLAIGATAIALTAFSFVRPFARGQRFAEAGAALAIAGVLTSLHLASVLTPEEHPVVLALLLLAASTAVTSTVWRFEPGYYAAGLPLVIAAWNEVARLTDPLAVLFSTPLALYLIAASYLYARLDEGRENPLALDVLAVLVGLGYPVLVSLQQVGDRALGQALATVAVALIFVGAGVALKVRWYFFGGVIAVVVVALYRSFWAIAEYWWLVLGIVGVAMLVVALTWQRQRMVVADARTWLARSFEGWR